MQHESDNDSGYGNSDEDNDESNEDAEESSRHASLSRMKEMDSDGIPESVYRSIEAKRMAAPNSGVKVRISKRAFTIAIMHHCGAIARLHSLGLFYIIIFSSCAGSPC